MARCPELALNLVLSALFCLAPVPGQSQTRPDDGPAVSIRPDTIRTGDRFTVRVELHLPNGTTLRAPDSLAGTAGLRPAGPLELAFADSDDSGSLWSLSYPFLALRPGFRPIPILDVLIGDETDPGRNLRPMRVQLGGVLVESVLPPPGEPVPPVSLISPGPSDSRRGTTPLLLLLSSAFVAVLWIKTREKEGIRPARAEVPDPVGGARSVDELRRKLSRILEKAPSSPTGLESIVDDSIPLLRRILEARVTFDLASFTTPELLDLFGNGHGMGRESDLGPVLRIADAVRFRSSAPSPEEVHRFRSGLSSWLEAQSAGTGNSGGEHG